jgi:hypothetical protein
VRFHDKTERVVPSSIDARLAKAIRKEESTMSLRTKALVLSAVLAGCGGEVIDVGDLGARRLAVDSGDATSQCTNGVPLDTISTSQGLNPADYSYGVSPRGCGEFSAEQVSFTHAVPGAYVGLYHQASASGFAGQTTRLSVLLRGESVGGAILDVNESDDSSQPVGFATSEGFLDIRGSFDWTPFVLTFAAPSNVAYFDIAVDLENAGTLEVAPAVLTVEP